MKPESNALTEWANEPSVADLKQDVAGATSDFNTHITKVSRYLDNLNVTGSAKITTRKGRSAVQPKLIRKQAEWRYSALADPFLSSDDLFNVEPVTHEDVDAAYQNALVLNNQFNTKINKIRFIDEYVRTAVDEGTVIVKVGWDYQDKEIMRRNNIYDYVVDESPEHLQMLEQLSQMMADSPSDFLEVDEDIRESVTVSIDQGKPIRAVVVDYTEEVADIQVLVNKPTIEVCNYRNVLIDPTCNGNVEDAQFITYRYESTPSDLRKSGKYTDIDKISIDDASPEGDPDFDSPDRTSFRYSDDSRKKVVVNEYWGFWDIDNSGTTTAIVATWVGNTMIQMALNPFPDGELPFVVVPYLPVRKSVYGEPDGVLIEDNQQIVGAVTRGMIDIMARSANGQTGLAKGMLDPVNKTKFSNLEDYEYNPIGVDPRVGFNMHTFPEIPRSAHEMLQLQNNEAESLTGVKAFSSGISGSALGNTATGVRSALDATAKRELGILNRLADGIKRVGRKIVAMNAAWLSEEEVVRVTNEKFVTVKRKDLAGNTDLKLSISTAESDEQKASELAFMLQTTAQSMGSEFATLILSEIAKLRKMPELAEKIAKYVPEPDPIEQENRQLENELLKAKIASEMALAKQYETGGQLDLARASTEVAKAGNLQSDTDLKDLSFVEQETGTDHARALQLQEEGTKQNLKAKVMDSLMKAGSDSTTKTTNGMRPT